MITEITADKLLETIEELKKKQFDILLSISGVERTDCFEVVYHLFSTVLNKTAALKVKLDKNKPETESLTGLYSAANWHERETYDMFGIKFNNHPNPERLLMPADWKGFPLRKNYVNDDERLCWNTR